MGPLPLKGADGVVRSTSEKIIGGLNEPPRLRGIRLLRSFLLIRAATPPLPRRGVRPVPTVSRVKDQLCHGGEFASHISSLSKAQELNKSRQLLILLKPNPIFFDELSHHRMLACVKLI